MNYFTILTTGIIIFVICLVLHIVIWRWWHPKRRVIALFLLFIILPLLFIIGYVGLERLVVVPSVLSFTMAGWLSVYLFHFALASAYILSYPAIEAVSPSLAIVLMLGASNSQGIAHKDLLPLFDDETVLEPRIKDLMEAGLVTASDNYFTVTPRGMTLVQCFILLRRVLGLPIGKG
ncbi:MAG: hypothetical protein A3G39_11030 [Deltaproteobacteria bacterium RIFCSPLOWO2_12_FULL_43_16]|nr:MAG: hypothetical protein A2Z89_09125 [Deltaproteobacteria bacterium GWA2_43_19]OGQ13135.1 MAG: hypothetical protein A3D30_10010 [Deltaproteobacteria bacterium RIFCSPHIGHO2_02_FULL_43_33]OGQ57408.1 MAG: hypothetical protein A3G39_11030 [Deltaproteobacteria bacterium RIFCSPLOWO2_12_FULL_43_16]HBR16949.1 hypothetical protein [Deltaproteobacteria bacterium]